MEFPLFSLSVPPYYEPFLHVSVPLPVSVPNPIAGVLTIRLPEQLPGCCFRGSLAVAVGAAVAVAGSSENLNLLNEATIDPWTQAVDWCCVTVWSHRNWVTRPPMTSMSEDYCCRKRGASYLL